MWFRSPQVPAAEERDEVLAERLPQRVLEEARVVAGILGAAGRVEVEGEGHDPGCRDGIPAGLREQNEADLRIGRAGGADDVRVLLAGIETHLAVLHVEAPVEREPLLGRVAGGEADLGGGGVRFGDRLHQRGGEPRGVVDLLVGIFPVLGHGALVEVVAQGAREKRAGVRMGRRDGNVSEGNAGRRARFLARLPRDPGRHPDEVAEDKGRAGVALAEDERLRLQRILHAGAQALGEVAAHPVGHRRGDVDHRHPGPQGFGVGAREGRENKGGENGEFHHARHHAPARARWQARRGGPTRRSSPLW